MASVPLQQVQPVLELYRHCVVWVERAGGNRFRQQRAFPLYGRGKRNAGADLSTHESIE